MKTTRRFYRSTLLSLLISSSSTLLYAETNPSPMLDETAQTDQSIPQGIASPPSKLTDAPNNKNLLDTIPAWVDATPTIFPEQSSQPIVPKVDDSKDRTWIDRKQQKIRDWVDRTSIKIDNWFGDVDPDEPASATLRVLVDTYWDKHHDYEVKPRIRGKIKLPTLEKRLSVVFGDDSLDDEFDYTAGSTNLNTASSNNKTIDSKQVRDENSSIALRWSHFSKSLPFKTDIDLGVRSGDDLYIRAKAKKDWQLRNDFHFVAEQIYRYGIDSENYLRTNLELIHARPQQAILANQFNLTYADTQDDDFVWENRTFRRHQFFAENQFTYGLYTGGYYNDNELRLNSWGPFVSWRQPFLREWFFVQADLNYFDDHREDYSHYLSTFIRLEALF